MDWEETRLPLPQPGHRGELPKVRQQFLKQLRAGAQKEENQGLEAGAVRAEGLPHGLRPGTSTPAPRCHGATSTRCCSLASRISGPSLNMRRKKKKKKQH